MEDEPLLSDLCSICNNAKFKYRCPGCDARTCSLPCYKRHQQWAQCTGKRDPTKYVKKSQLVTPAGIDHDFNFLTRIERGMDRAERGARERGVGPASDSRSGPRKGEVGDRQFEAAGVKVIRAPKGLSRSKENKTHRSSKGNIVWTVEWLQDGKTRLLSEAPALQPIIESYCRSIDQPLQGKKRKRTTENASNDLQEGDNVPVVLQRGRGDASIEEVDKEAEHPATGRGDPETELESKERDPGVGGSGADLTAIEPTEAGGSASYAPVASNEDQRPSIAESSAESVATQYHFFLLRPQTSSRRPVLVPLSSSALLQDCLRGRTVLEYPTIYVFSSPCPEPSDGFMLEEEFLKNEPEEQQHLRGIPQVPQPLTQPSGQSASDLNNADEEIDSSRVLEVLKQDLGASV